MYLSSEHDRVGKATLLNLTIPNRIITSTGLEATVVERFNESCHRMTQ